MALVAGPTLIGASILAPAAAEEFSEQGITTEDLADDSAAQQRWSSVPESRIVLNPYDYDREGSEVEQTTGPSLPLHVGYYANDEAVRIPGFLRTYAASAQGPSGVSYRAALADSFDDLAGWTANSLSAAASSGAAALTLDKGAAWGHLEREISIDDVATARYLTIDVGALSGGAQWNVKINAGGGTDLPDLQPDSSESGLVTFDLGEAYGWEQGPKTVRLKIYAVNKTSSQPVKGTVAIRSLTLHNGADLPDQDRPSALADDMTASSVSEWPRAQSYGGTASMTSDGSQGTVRLGNSSFGAVERTVTTDVTASDLLSVVVPETSGQWSLKLSTGTAGDITVQPDTSATGVFTYDLAGITGWTGTRTFTVKLFHIGNGGWTTFERLSIYDGDWWLRTAEAVDHTWSPEALDSSGRFADGSIDVRDVFHDTDSFSRTVDARIDGSGVVAGTYQGSATWDPTDRVITVQDRLQTYAVALPEGADVSFGSSTAELGTVGGADQPSGTTGAWLAELTQGVPGVVGVGFAVNDSRVSDDPPVSARERALAAAQGAAMDREHWRAFWDEYLGKVPVPQDFSLRAVEPLDVTPEDVERFYYKAWIGLEQNVLPATPETGNHFAQVGTGKPSMYMHGTPGTKNVASWDSLLGMQNLVYTDPENAWEAFRGQMALVEGDGKLGGESLPSRKAQTAWVLYQVTGDRDQLEASYEPLAQHLRWAQDHMRWIFPGHDFADERDSEFVASLELDLESAVHIANELDRPGDAAEWQERAAQVTDNYEEWFFPQTGGFSTVQKVYLDTSRTSAPVGSDHHSGPFLDTATGRWTDPGLTMYTTTALVMDGLDDEYVAKIDERFDADFDAAAQFAGLAEYAIKAPDAQLMAYGLLDRDRATAAGVLVDALTRDMVRSGWFAEVYQASPDGLEGTPIARGVRPSLFGISNLIENVWITNGYRQDRGNPSFVQLSGAVGGIAGLQHLGQTYDLDLDGARATFSGPAAEGVCDAIDLAEGQTATWEDCVPATPHVELETQAQTRCLAGKAYVVVRATNVGAEAVDVSLETPFGSRTVAAVVPGASAYQSFAVRASDVDAGSGTVLGSLAGGSGRTWDVAYDATSCS